MNDNRDPMIAFAEVIGEEMADLERKLLSLMTGQEHRIVENEKQIELLTARLELLEEKHRPMPAPGPSLLVPNGNGRSTA